jgi:death on curing protein
MTPPSPTFLSTDDVLRIHADQIARYGGALGIRDVGLLDSAVAMPRQQFGGVLLHHDLASMAAAYLFHLTKNHPFLDGNKRVGAAAAIVFLHLNECRLTCSNETLVDWVLGVAAGSVTKDELCQSIRAALAPSG